MSVKISQLPNYTSANLVANSSAVLPLVADSNNWKTTIANVKTYVQTGNLNITGAITANNTSTLANLVITGNLNVQGTTTTTSSQNLSTNSSIIDLHTFSSNLDPWTSDDGRDIGFRFYYYKGTASTAALYWEHDDGALVWVGAGAGNSNVGQISNSSVLGTMRLGQMLVSNNTATTGNASGALQVSGGASVGGNLYVGANATIGNISSAGVINFTGNGTFGNVRSNTAVTVGSNLTVTSIATVNSLNVNTFATIGTTLVASANITANGLWINTAATITTLGVTGNAAIGNVNVDGNVNASYYFGNGAGLTGLVAASSYGNSNVQTYLTSGATTITVTGTSSLNGNVNTNNIMPFGNANANIGSGSLQFNTVFAKATLAQYADLAENYIADADYAPGTVVIFGGENEITTTDIFADTRVAGVISTDPAYLMNSQQPGLPVALRGKVPVKVVGKVTKGDLLITSTTPGYAEAMGFRSESPNSVFAKSLVNDNSYEPRTIWAVIL